jgi:hypothetical protein
MSKELGKVQSMSNEAEKACAAISEFTHVKYKVKDPDSDFPPATTDGIRWYVAIDNWRDSKRAEYAASIWEDGAGIVWIQSAGLGDLAALVLQEHDKESYERFRELDLSNFASRAVRKKFVALFPKIGAYLLKCDESIQEVSSKTGVTLQMKFEGGFDERIGESLLLWMVARLDVKGLDSQKKLEKIKFGLASMKEALAQAGGGKWWPLDPMP